MNTIVIASVLLLSGCVQSEGRANRIEALSHQLLVEIPALRRSNERLARAHQAHQELLHAVDTQQQLLTAILAGHGQWHEALASAQAEVAAIVARHTSWGPNFVTTVHRGTTAWGPLVDLEAFDGAWQDVAAWADPSAEDHRLGAMEEGAVTQLVADRDRCLRDAEGLRRGLEAAPAIDDGGLASRQGLGEAIGLLTRLALGLETQRALVASLRFQRERLREDVLSACRQTLRRQLAERSANLAQGAYEDLDARAPQWDELADIESELDADTKVAAVQLTRSALAAATRTGRIMAHRLALFDERARQGRWSPSARHRLADRLQLQQARVVNINEAAAFGAPRADERHTQRLAAIDRRLVALGQSASPGCRQAATDVASAGEAAQERLYDLFLEACR